MLPPVESSFSLLPNGRSMTISSDSCSCLQCPSSLLYKFRSRCQSAFVDVSFLLSLLSIMMFCFKIWHTLTFCTCIVRLYLEYSRFLMLFGEHLRWFLCLSSLSFPFSAKPTFQKLLIFLCQPESLFTFLRQKGQRSTSRILQLHIQFTYKKPFFSHKGLLESPSNSAFSQYASLEYFLSTWTV